MFGVFKRLFWKPPPAPPVVEAMARPVEPPPPPPPPKPQPPPQRIATTAGDLLSMPLDPILDSLPYTLAPLVLTRPGGTFAYPLSEALKQLPTGAVRIAIAELRRGSPPGTFAQDFIHDNSLIDLPLPLVLAAMGSGALTRRPEQKRTVVPDEVIGVFLGPHGRLNPNAAVAAPAYVPAPPMPPTPPPPPVAPKPPAPDPFATPPIPVAPALEVFGGDKIVTSVAAVWQGWPAPVRQEIQQLGLTNASIAIPFDRLEAGMKTGRVMFTWMEVGGWLSSPPAPSPLGESQLEMPLKVMTPLFLAKFRTPAPRRTVIMTDIVEDIFTGLRSPTAAPPMAPAKPAAMTPAVTTTAPPAAPVAAPAPAYSALGELLGQPSKMDWTPAEVVEFILGLPGVSGAIFAASDGLLVAGRAPVPLKADMLAAFLPQIFNRVAEYTLEAQLGAVRAMKLWTGHAPCVIYKAGRLYLAVLPRAGQALPEATLERIATEMGQDKR